MVKEMKKYINAIITAAAVILAIIPFILLNKAAFNGTDSRATEIIKEISPGAGTEGIKIWSPPGCEVETLIFSLQAAAGSGIVFFIIGYYIGKNKKGKKDASD
jgi:cobalt/nickel transport protein